MHGRYFPCAIGLALFLVTVFSLSGCGNGGGNPDTEVKRIPPLSYYTSAPDLIDIARFSLGELPDKTAYLKATGEIASSLGDAVVANPDLSMLSNNTTTYDNWTWKIAQGVGTRLLLADLSDEDKAELLASDPQAYLALPLRFVIIIDEYDVQNVLHICLVDPVRYLRQFYSPGAETVAQLQKYKEQLLYLVRDTFTQLNYDPRQADTAPEIPSGVAPLVDLNTPSEYSPEVTVKTMVDGGLYAGGIRVPEAEKDGAVQNALDGTLDVDEDGNGDGPYSVEELEVSGLLSFVPDFKPFKSGAANLSPAMQFIVSNSFILALDGEDQALEYDTDGDGDPDTWQLLVYDANAPAMLLTASTSFFASLPLSIIVQNTDTGASVTLQNPLYNTLRYFAAISPTYLQQVRERWNSVNVDAVAAGDLSLANKVYWPDWSLEQMGQISRETIERNVSKAFEE